MGTGLVLVAGLLLATSLFAQGRGMRKQGASQQQQAWLKFEKELGLQTRYSADMEIQTMGMNMPCKVYRTEGKTRSEMTMPFMNMRMVALQLPVNGKTVSYSLFPDKKKYCIKPEEEAAEAAGTVKPPQVKMEELGTEVYEGVTCKKRRMTVTSADGTVNVMTLLFSPAQKDMPVKIDSQVTVVPEPGAEPMTVTSVVLIKNYEFGAPAASLFTIPKDYTQAANMSEIMMGGGGLGGLTPPGQPASGQPAGLQEALRRAQLEQQAETEAAQKEAAKGAVNQGINQGIGRGLRSLLGQ
jgi:hypothetical protein